jgi:hypothetical protein
MESLDGAQGMKQLGPIHCAHCRAEKNFMAPKWWIQRSITHKQGAVPAKRKSERIVCALLVLFDAMIVLLSMFLMLKLEVTIRD